MAEQDLVNKVQRLRSQNLSNDEIARRLLYEGYSNSQVFDAISVADTQSVSEQGSEQTMEYTDQPQQFYSQPTQSSFEERPAQSSIDVNKIEEIAESIIEDKWNELVEHVNRIIEWKSSMELKLASTDEQIKGLKSDFDTLHKAILGKITDTDSVMREVSTDVKALEQVFKKILPGFVENVNELSRITQSLRKK